MRTAIMDWQTGVETLAAYTHVLGHRQAVQPADLVKIGIETGNGWYDSFTAGQSNQRIIEVELA